jgi:hypothetical protein
MARLTRLGYASLPTASNGAFSTTSMTEDVRNHTKRDISGTTLTIVQENKQHGLGYHARPHRTCIRNHVQGPFHRCSQEFDPFAHPDIG